MSYYELRDHVDDLPYARTFTDSTTARRAAEKKAKKLGHPVQVWLVHANGEQFILEV